MSVLQELVDLPTDKKQAMGITATAGEIAQQPATWKTTRRIFAENSGRICAFLEAAGVTASLEQRPTVILTGAGTSDYIGQVLSLLLRTEWGCETFAIPSTDLLTNMADYIVPGRRYLWISFSRSGGSPEGVTALVQALQKFPEIAHLVITCNADGRMMEIVRAHKRTCAIVLDDTVNDRGLAMTSSYSNMVICGQCLAHAWSQSSYDMIFNAMVHASEAFLPVAAECAQELAATHYKRICILGSGALTGVAKESALKVLEMTAGQIKTMSESILGLRHGPMAALDKDTLLVCFGSGDPRRQRYEVDLLNEVGNKQIVAKRVVVAPSAAGVFSTCSDRLLTIEDGIPDLYRPPVDVIFGQLLGLYFSLAQGLKPDSPSPQGVITRVVAEFRIYE